MKNAGPCANCKCEVWIPDALYEAAHASEKVGFFCAYGHSLVFRQGETEAEKLRRERDRLTQRLAEKDDEIARQRQLREETERTLVATKGHLTRGKKRAAAGTCPCCQRTFGNMAEHMKAQHPQFVADSGAKVVPNKRKAGVR